MLGRRVTPPLGPLGGGVERHRAGRLQRQFQRLGAAAAGLGNGPSLILITPEPVGVEPLPPARGGRRQPGGRRRRRRGPGLREPGPDQHPAADGRRHRREAGRARRRRLRVRRLGRRGRRGQPRPAVPLRRRLHHRRRSTTSPARCSASTRASTSPASRRACSASRARSARSSRSTPRRSAASPTRSARAPQSRRRRRSAFTPLYVGGDNPFNDPARAKEQALSLVAKGADYVMAAAAAGNLGVFDAAEGRRLQGLRRRRQPVPGRARARRRQRHQGGRRRHRRQHRQRSSTARAAAWSPTA